MGRGTVLPSSPIRVVFRRCKARYNMQPFYDIENLNTYPNVNPAKEKGHAACSTASHRSIHRSGGDDQIKGFGMYVEPYF